MENVLVSIEDGVQKITFNRPSKRNAINIEMYNTIIDALSSAATNDDIKLTVFTGNGKYYSSGNDFKPADAGNRTMEEILHEGTETIRKFIRALINFPKPLIAVVNGPAIGIAVTTLGLCDIVYAVDTATFHTPFTKLGLTAEGCSSYTFPKILGPSLANEMLYYNYKMSAKEAKKRGFVANIFPLALLPSIMKKIKDFAQMPMKPVLFTKQLTSEGRKETLHKVNDMEIDRLYERFQSDEFIEALMSFSKSKL